MLPTAGQFRALGKMFEKEAERFPEALHIIIKFNENIKDFAKSETAAIMLKFYKSIKKRAQLHTDIAWNRNDLGKKTNLVNSYIAGKRCFYYLIRPSTKTWETKIAEDAYERLSRATGKLLYHIPNSISGFGDDWEHLKEAGKYKHEAIWTIFVHNIYSSEEDSPFAYSVEQIVKLKDNVPQSNMVVDVFLKSALACEYLADRLEKADKEQNGDNAGETKNKSDTENIAVDDKELTILIELNAGSNKTFSQVEIEAATSIKRGTIKDKLPRLEKIGLIHRPLGERKGYQITDKGREIAKRHQ